MPNTNELIITMRRLRAWQACEDGRQWFESKFPQGATYAATQQALRADNRPNDSRWLADRAFDSLLEDPAGVAGAVADDTKQEIAALVEKTHPERIEQDTAANFGNYAQIGSSGDSAQIGSSGNYAQIGSSGDSAQIGSSGNSAQIGSSGDSAQIGSSGNSAKIGSSGYYAQIGSSGDSAKIGSSGYYAQIGSSGDSAKIGSSGNSAKIGSSGNYAQIGSSGDSAKIGSSGNSAKIGSSGDHAKVNASGKNASVACIGIGSIARAAVGGFIALSWHDEKSDRPRITVGYVGENIDADTWYGVNDCGELVEVDAPSQDDD